jgi:MurNAc alpha-1-phosphate uridylyltransferase
MGTISREPDNNHATQATTTIMRAMILAAGRGERMGELTERQPKPLLEVAGKALVEHTIARLCDAGVRELVINLAYRGQQIRERLGDGARYGATIVYSQEPEGALDTGGGIAAALDLLGPEPFIVVNSDVMTDFDFARLGPPARLAHLIMVPNPPHHPDGDFFVRDGVIDNASGVSATFSGIGVYAPQLFAGRPAGRFALAPLLREAIAAGDVSGSLFKGLWLDVGTPARLALAQTIVAPQHHG